MKINVCNIVDETVYGETCFGSVYVRWMSEKPEVGKTYHVELDIADHLIWCKDITLASSNNYSITYDETSIFLFGVIDSVEDDGFSALRIGSCIIPLITQGTAFEIGSHVRVSVTSISAYVVNL